MASLSYRSAAKIAAREMRSSRGKFLFVLLSVAIGVAALTGVRGFSASFRTTLLLRARSIMAADLSARTFQQLTPEEQRSVDSIRATGVQTTTVVAEDRSAAHPLALPAGGRHLVARPFGNHFAFELGERQKDIQGEPAERGGGVELLGDGHERGAVAVEHVHDPAEVQQRAGQPVNLIDHDAV